MAKTKKLNKRTVMHSLTINEISGVDRPAQKGARVVLMKRAGDDVYKGMSITGAKGGHSHLVYDDEQDGGETSWNNGHAHPWVRTGGGIKIGESDNHTHSVAPTTKKDKTRKGCYSEDNMSEEEIKVLQDRLAKAEASAKRSEAVAALTDVEKQYFVNLKGEDADGFLAKSAEDRSDIVKKAAGENPVVFTGEDGSEFRKNDDPRLIAMAKKMDEANRAVAKERALAKRARFAKRAEDEMSHLPGEATVKVEMLKALDGAPAEHAEAIKEILKAADTALAKSFVEKGTEVGNEDASGEDQLDRMAKALQEKNPGMSYAKAYDSVLATPEGAALY